MKKAIVEQVIELRRKGASIFEQWSFLQQACTHENEDSPEAICAIFSEWKNHLVVIQQTQQLLQEKDIWNIAELVEKLGNSGQSSVTTYLLPYLESTNRIIREKVIRALGKLGQDSTIPILVRCLKHEHLQDQKLAIAALGRLQAKEAEPFIRPFLQSSFSEIRIECWKALGKILAAENSCWEQAFQDNDAYVRRTAIEELGQKKEIKCYHLFLKALQDPYYEVRQKAAEALGTLGETKALPILKEHLKDLSFHVRIECATALVRLGEKKEGFFFLKKCLQEESSSIRAYTIKCLGALPYKEVLPTLLSFIQDSEKLVRYALAKSLKTQGKQALPYLLRLSEDHDEGVRNAALNAIYQIRQNPL